MNCRSVPPSAASAALEVVSTNQGPLPHLDDTQMWAISSPTAGLLACNTIFYDVTYTGPSVGRSFPSFFSSEPGKVTVGSIGTGDGSTGTFSLGVAVYGGTGFNGTPPGQLTVPVTFASAGASNVADVDVSAMRTMLHSGQPYTMRLRACLGIRGW